ncbi:ABC transporter permease [Neofamilia massiliensis]|uniref:ABC transporter permease n=1 Tax=Neofamilia massiliensis TaxID=1673724 RepID=UPI0006BB9273|nr:ABC transporter permease [Neofamilia massiliensis]
MNNNKFANFLKKPIVAILFALLLGLLVGAIVFALAGFNPGQAYGIMIREIFTKPKNFSQVVVNAVPIIFTGLAFSFTSRAGLFNIGIEGQFMLGAMTAALVGHFIGLPMVIHPLVILILAFLIGGLWGAFSGFLKAKFAIHEVISTIMLNWIAYYLNNFIVNLDFVKEPNTLHSKAIRETAVIKFVSTEWRRSEAGREFIKANPFLGNVIKTDVGWGIILAIIFAILFWFILNHTKRGYEVRAVGLNKYAAEFSGISVDKNIIFTMFISGGLAALGGAILVMTSTNFISVLAGQEGYGWDGMSVALIGNTSPLGVLPAGLLFAALSHGGTLVQSQIGAPTEIIKIIIGVIVLAIAIASLLPRLADNLSRRSLDKSLAEKNKEEAKDE